MSITGGVTLADEVLRPYEAVRGHSPQRETLQVAWATYWGTTYGTPAFWFAYAQYGSKLDELANLLVAHSRDERSRQLFAGAVGRLRAHLDPSFLGNTISSISGLDETFNIVHLASGILPQSLNDKIEPITVETISRYLEELLTDLAVTEIDVQLSQFLRGNLAFLKWAVDNYVAIGTDGLSKAYGMVASEFIRAWGKRDHSEPSETFWQKARNTMKLVGEGVIWSEKVAAGADKLLTHADDIASLIT